MIMFHDKNTCQFKSCLHKGWASSLSRTVCQCVVSPLPRQSLPPPPPPSSLSLCLRPNVIASSPSPSRATYSPFRRHIFLLFILLLSILPLLHHLFLSRPLLIHFRIMFAILLLRMPHTVKHTPRFAFPSISPHHHPACQQYNRSRIR